ncbi:hypothetical protein BGCPKDLD_1666 [Methylorubrum suomiense]|uniref:Uncharacterized protein n=1 Tax=Methylorubrum suomiense TaxID=144191 RepID=A0ABQ4USE7_9HYPH|nr:hypothetical protein BGCPKDLD_1666 [Methylorubrum suomiense]
MTILAATAICAAALTVVGYGAGARPDDRPLTGLTAATILGTPAAGAPGDHGSRRKRAGTVSGNHQAEKVSPLGEGTPPADGPQG